MLPSSQPVEQRPVSRAPARPGLAILGPETAPPPPPEPPHQPWLRGAASVALHQGPDPALPPRRARARWLFRHPRRLRLQQMLVLRGALLPFAIGPVPLQSHFPTRRRSKKLPVISCDDPLSAASQGALARLGDDLSPEDLARVFAANPRPTECAGGISPCPWVSCRHHLYLEVHPTSGAIRLNHPDLTLEEMPFTCSLDAAADGPASLSQVAERLGITHERVRQIEVDAQATFAVGQGQLRRRSPAR